jgi:hypothetical protein
MPGIRSIFGRSKQLSVGQRHDLVARTALLYREGRDDSAVLADLRAAGVAQPEAEAISAEARERFEAELLRRTQLPASAGLDINYYFLLGVTPQASVEEIRRAYRRKALAVHPDQHHKEFTREYWSSLMQLVGDAQHVLTDSQLRRAYDVLWRQRSRKVAAENRKRGQDRGDWETRYRWEIAKLAQLENQMATMLEELHGGLQTGASSAAVVAAIYSAIENYEGDLVDVRTQSHTLDERHRWLAEQVRHETQRKDRLVRQLHDLQRALGDAGDPALSVALAPQVADVMGVLAAVREAQHKFDLRSVRT